MSEACQASQEPRISGSVREEPQDRDGDISLEDFKRDSETEVCWGSGALQL